MRINHTVRFGAVACAFFGGHVLSAQVTPVELHTAEVVAPLHDVGAFASFAADSLLVVALPGASAGELLAAGSTLNLRQYGGYGSLITGALRGLSADHFAVTWNGMPIHSASLGLTDLSALPASVAEATRTQSGALTSDLPAGAAAGRLHLGAPKSVGLVLGAGYDNLLNLRNWAGLTLRPTSKITVSSRYQRDRAENRFRYNDPYMAGAPERTQEHNAFSRDALMTQVRIDAGHRLKLNTAVWLQRSVLELPEILGSFGQSFDVQRDSLIRLTGNAQYATEAGVFDLTLGRSAEGQRFTVRNAADAAPSIDSRITAIRNYANLTYSSEYKNLSYRFSASLSDETARSGSHPDGARRLLSGASAFGRYVFGGWMGEAAFRMDGGQGAAVPVPELRLGRQLIGGKLMAQVRRVFRYPDLNELFWTPGGNLHLAPEDGMAFDLGWKKSTVKDAFSVDYFFLVYHQEMQNMIVWTTGFDGLQALNVREVSSTGAHVRGEMRHRISPSGQMRYTTDVNAQHNSGLSDLESRFFPELQSRLSAAYLQNGWFLSLALRYTANEWKPERMNSVKGAQDAVLMADAMAGVQLRVNDSELCISAVVQNMGDVMDHRIAAFATPGRIASLRLQWKLIDNPIRLYKPNSP